MMMTRLVSFHCLHFLVLHTGQIITVLGHYSALENMMRNVNSKLHTYCSPHVYQLLTELLSSQQIIISFSPVAVEVPNWNMVLLNWTETFCLNFIQIILLKRNLW